MSNLWMGIALDHKNPPHMRTTLRTNSLLFFDMVKLEELTTVNALGFGFGLGLGFGVARVLLVGQTVPDQ